MDYFKEVWELAKIAGPFGTAIMAYLWYRREHQLEDLQKRYDVLLERVLNGLNEGSNSIRDLREFFAQAGKK